MPERSAHVPHLIVPALREMPGPRRWPVVGDPAALGGTRDLITFYESYWRRYGDVYRVPMLGSSMIIITHPDAIKHVLWSNRQNYYKGDVYKGARRIMGDSLLTLEGDAWKERRSLEQPAFHRQSIQRLSEQMAASGAGFFTSLAQRAHGGAIRVDAHREMVKLTLDVVVRALFGQVIESSAVSYDTLSEALEIVSESANRFHLPEWLPTAHNRKVRDTLAKLDRTMFEFIDHVRAQDEGDTLLAMLVRARDAQGAPLPNRAIRDEVMTMFIAGHETTALTLTWLFTLLEGRADVVTRMREEVDGVLGAREPTFQDLPQLTYVRQVIDETLRLRPPAPLLARNTLANDVIGGYPIRAGEVVMPFLWATHRHPDFWSEPSRFDPDRFHHDRADKRQSYSYVPFSAGPRACIGNMFSLVETTILLAQLMQRFDLTVSPSAHVKPIAMVTARPSAPVYVELRPRAR